MSLVRAFLAVPLPEHLKKTIHDTQKDLQARIPQARWTRLENLHLTLHFFAEIEQETLEKLKVSMLSLSGCQRPFQVEVKGLGAFPNPHRPRVIWLGLKPRHGLDQLYRNTGKSLQQAGLVADPRPFSPHLTIARLRGGQPDLTALFSSFRQETIGRLPLDRLILYESRLRPDGAEHIPLLTVNLDDENIDRPYAT